MICYNYLSFTDENNSPVLSFSGSCYVKTSLSVCSSSRFNSPCHQINASLNLSIEHFGADYNSHLLRIVSVKCESIFILFLLHESFA